MEVILKVDDLGISFGSNEVLKSVNFELYNDEVLGVIGPNGAGKTVMLNILTGILAPSKGSITYKDEDIKHKKITERCSIGIGRTFQVPRPFEEMTVLENIMVGGVFGSNLREKDAKEKAVDIAQQLGLDDKLMLFSGKLGLLDRKRLEIGRALATDPCILLLDEVGGGLTESEVESIIYLVTSIKARGVSVIWIEHIIKTMVEGTDRVLLLAEGKNIICGKPLDVMNSKECSEAYMGGDSFENE
jgi:branched-chain amino acid transport system ATP-binding protein